MLKAGLVKSGCSQVNKASFLSFSSLIILGLFQDVFLFLVFEHSKWAPAWCSSGVGSRSAFTLDNTTQYVVYLLCNNCSYIQLFRKSSGSFSPKLLASRSAISLLCCMGFFVQLQDFSCVSVDLHEVLVSQVSSQLRSSE